MFHVEHPFPARSCLFKTAMAGRPRHLRGQLQIIRQRLCGVEHGQHQPGLRRLRQLRRMPSASMASPSALNFHDWWGRTVQPHAQHGLHIAGRTGHGRGQGHGQTRQRVLFAHVGPPQQHTVHAMAQHRARAVAGDQRVQRGLARSASRTPRRTMGTSSSGCTDPGALVSARSRLQRGLYLTDAFASRPSSADFASSPFAARSPQ